MAPWILVSCLLCGFAFAVLAAWLTTTRGNTIAEIVKENKLGDEALRAEVKNVFSFHTAIPIIGLFAIAGAITIVLPGYIWMTQQKSAACANITLTGSLDLVDRQTGKSVLGKFHITPAEASLKNGLRLPLFYVPKAQDFSLEPDRASGYGNINLGIKLDPENQQFSIKATNVPKQEAKVDVRAGEAQLAQPIRIQVETDPTLQVEVAPPRNIKSPSQSAPQIGNPPPPPTEKPQP